MSMSLVNFFHSGAKDFLDATLRSLEHRGGRYCNTILSQAIAAIPSSFLRSGRFHSNNADPRPYVERRFEVDLYHCPEPKITDEFYLTSWSCPDDAPVASTQLDFVLSCTKGKISTNPIFLCSLHPSAALTPEFLNERIPRFVYAFRQYVDPDRVFSVFGPDPLTEAFCTEWSRQTGKVRVPEPYYAAKLSFCTLDTLAPPPAPRDGDPDYRARLAKQADLKAVAVMCKDFADDSVTFPLSIQDATREAQALIRLKQLWVLEMRLADGAPEIVCIVAVTRTYDQVATISKVFTPERGRGKGCATRLVREVCSHYLDPQRENKQEVVLYVAHDNKGAVKAYHRVGFVGLSDTEPVPAEVENWIEIGFSDTDKGHW